MPLLPRFSSLLSGLFRRAALDRDLDDELQAALDELAARKIAGGLEPEAARRAARLELGGVQQVKEDVRGSRIGAGFVGFLADVRVAWRGLWKTPGFAVAVILTLALGIGANTAIFTVVNAVLLQPLPYRDANRVVFIWSDLSQAGYPRGPIAGPELFDLRERARRFEGIGGIWANTTTLTGEQPEQLRIGLVTTNFFSVLGADPFLGRTFGAEDEVQNPPPTILLSHALWQRRYGSDPKIVGRRILVNGAPVTVIGVMPESFKLWFPADSNVPEDLQAFRPLSPSIRKWSRGQQFLRVVARMRPSVSVQEADREVRGIAREIGHLSAEYGQSPPVFFAVGLQQDGVRTIRSALVMLFGGVTVLLLIACVNVANLLIARAAARGHEVSLRIALGVSKFRLTRQCLIDGLLLAVLGLVAGLLLARQALVVLLALRPEGLNRIATARLDLQVLAFAAAISIGWGLLFSLAPLLEVFRADVASALRRAGRASSARLHYRVRTGLVFLQITLGIFLLVGAGLLVRTFMNLQRVDVGFRTEGALTFRVALPFGRLRGAPALAAFSRQLQDSLGRLPGVVRVGGISHLPYDNLPNWATPYAKEGDTDLSISAREADARTVTPEFFGTVQARLIEGRLFTDDDDLTHPRVAIVDDRLAARLWPGQSAVGKRVMADPGTTGSPKTPVTIIGVVRHLRHRTPAAEVREQMYFPQLQVFRSPMAYVLRARVDPATLTSAVRKAVAALDPQLPIYDVRPFSEYSDAALGVSRFTTMLALVFAGVALVLAAVGVYGVLSYGITRRRHELAIRLALGANRGRLIWMVLREAIILGGAGVAAGLGVAALASPLFKAQLYGVTTVDPLVYGIAVPVLALTVVAAALVPARRATSVEALESLRAD